MPTRPTRRRRLAAGIAIAAGVLALATAAAPATAATPTCSAVLFVPVNETGAYMVEQPDSAPGAIFCEPILGSREFGVAEAPAHGTIQALLSNGLGGATFSYTPTSGFAGADSFTLSARDGGGEPATVRLEVRVRPAQDDPPVCSVRLSADQDGDAYRVENGAAVAGSIDCFDDEGAELSFTVQAAPAHGTLSEIEPEGADAASFTYTPSPAYEGADGFSLVANDGTQDSAPAAVEVTIVPVADDPPRCTATLVTTSDATGVFEVEQGETARGAVNCVDEQSDALDFAVGAQPGHGVLAPLSASGDGGTDVAYTPAPGHLGFDSFRVDVSDTANPVVQVTVRVRVVAAHDDPPTCTAQLFAPVADGVYRVKQGAAVAGELDCEDDEGTALDYAVAGLPQHGSVTPVGDDGHFSYSAPASYAGPDEVALVANDGRQASQPVVLAITVVTAEDEPPACEVALGAGANAEGAYLVARDTEVDGRIVCSGNGDLDLTIAAPPGHGSVGALEPDGPASATFTYSPAPAYVGADAFTLAADDGDTDPAEMRVTVEVVEPSPDAPHCRARLHTVDAGGAYEVESGETVAGTLTCFDSDGDELAFSVARAPNHGTIAGLVPVAAGVARFTYVADAASTGHDSFALVSSDGAHSSEAVEVQVTVVPAVDDPPECEISLFSGKLPSGAYPAEAGEDNPGAVVCVDDEGKPLTFAVVGGPRHGAIESLQGDGESAFFDYQADPGHLGLDAASIRARDPAGGEDVVTLELEVGPASNTAPSCTATLNAPLAGGSYKIVAGTSTPGEISCTDTELDPLAFSVVQSPSRATLSALLGTGNSRSFTYTAASGQAGPDEFSLKANDGRTDSAIVVVALQVEASTGGDGPAGPNTPVSPSASTPAPPSAPSRLKPKKCRKGSKKKKVRGKVKCVRKPKQHEAKKHSG